MHGNQKYAPSQSMLQHSPDSWSMAYGVQQQHCLPNMLDFQPMMWHVPRLI